MEKRFDVVGFGAMNLDRLYRVERIAREGEHVPVKSVIDAAGGSAANTIAGLSCLGAKTGFVGAVGRDGEGSFLLDEFKAAGVDTRGIAILPGRTGIIIGFVDDEGERTLYPYPGANNMLSGKDIDTDYVNGAQMLHVTSFVGERQFTLQKKIAKGLSDTQLSFSPGDLYVKKGLATLMPFIKNSSVVFLNETEAKELTGRGYVDAAEILRDKGAKTVVVTLGGGGCFAAREEESCHVPSKEIKPVDTTGAGDAFAAGFLLKLLKGAALTEAGRYANQTAAACIRKAGARAWLREKKK